MDNSGGIKTGDISGLSSGVTNYSISAYFSRTGTTYYADGPFASVGIYYPQGILLPVRIINKNS